ncbi:MAG: sensor histidine kinase [Deltaproteobacteria bacterium]
MSLKTKVSLSVAALFVLSVTVASFFTLSFFEYNFKESIATQQRSLVLSLAENIDDKLRIAQNALISVAAVAPHDVFTNAEKAQRYLDSKNGLQSIFDNGIFFISDKGILIAESPFRSGRRGRDLWFRDWVQKTVTSRKPFISDPYISTHTPGQPAIVMTAPVFDSQGKMIGMMTGSLDLLGDNFLAKLSRERIGKGGYIYISDSNRIILVHPDMKRIMKPAAAPGVNKFFDMAVKGFEGSGETVTSYGISTLSSSKHLQMTSWIILANFPTAEVYAPLNTAKRYFSMALVILTIVLLTATWLITKRLMAPLASVATHVELLPQKSGSERTITIDAVDEIGVLANSFNAMVATMDKQRQELEEFNSSLEERITAAVSEIRRKDQLLIEKSRLATMGEMINNIAHQWRQPLNNVGLLVQNLQYGFESGDITQEEMRSEVEKIMETILFMSSTIDDFRNFFRQDKEKRDFRINDMLKVTTDLISTGLRECNIALQLEIMDTVSANGYPNEYSQVLLNILINAKDVLSERHLTSPKIIVRLFEENGWAVVTVWDNGGGIEENILPRIFDPYFSTKEPGKGTGIGLYMSKVIIEQNMDGRLSASNSGGGAEFRIELTAL